VLLCAVEAAVLEDLDAPDRGEFLAETAKAYRAREKCLELLIRPTAARADAKRAGELEAEAKKLAARKKSPAGDSVGQIEIINAWTQAATLLIDGVAYRVEVGERKTISHAAGKFTYSLREGDGAGKTGTVEPGKTMTIKVVAQGGS
jgi:hypothetical protein